MSEGCASFPLRTRDEACHLQKCHSCILSLSWCFPVGELHIRGRRARVDTHDGPGCMEWVPVWPKEAGYVEDMLLFCVSIVQVQENISEEGLKESHMIPQMAFFFTHTNLLSWLYALTIPINMFHAVKHSEIKINVTEDYLLSTFIKLLFIHHLLPDSTLCCSCICRF